MPGEVYTDDWRENFARLKPVTAESPLPTRQLKRMAARALARALSSAQRNEGRKQKRLSHKHARALAAQGDYADRGTQE